MPGLELETAPQALRAFIDGIVDDVQALLGDQLAAIILHGSLAMGSFYPPKSDVDLLILAHDLPETEGPAVYDLLARHHAARPYVGGLEASAILAADARTPRQPMPYLVHFSETTAGVRAYRDGALPVDEDLIAHLTVARHRGVSLVGPPPASLIGDLSWAAFLSSVRGDIDWIVEGENIATSPYYAVLNLCRWAMMKAVRERIVPSKEEAGVWALDQLPADLQGVVQQALDAYRAPDWPRSREDRQMAGGPWNRQALFRFRDRMREQL
jgi:predicted nucleotidyltransferase